MPIWSRAHAPSNKPTDDPWWDLEGPTARRERRRRRLRRLAAAMAWVDLAAVIAMVTLGPHAVRLAFLP
jgi:hypothetical protein